MKQLREGHTNDMKYTPYVKQSSKIDLEINQEAKYKSHSYESDSTDYQFLSNKMGLTGMYWTFIPLNVIALNGTIQFPNLVIMCCVDFRQIMSKKSINRLVCENFTEINIRLNDVRPNITVRQVGKKIRNRFKDEKRLNHFYFF